MDIAEFLKSALGQAFGKALPVQPPVSRDLDLQII